MRPHMNREGLSCYCMTYGLPLQPCSILPGSIKKKGLSPSGIRLPAHGTVPGALTDVKWQDWLAATRLAVREATKMTHADAAAAYCWFFQWWGAGQKYAIDALDDESLKKPTTNCPDFSHDRHKPLCSVFGMAEWTAFLPAFSRAAWLGLVPEFNPFKYNSFPVNGARQAYLLTETLKRDLTRRKSSAGWKDLPRAYVSVRS